MEDVSDLDVDDEDDDDEFDLHATPDLMPDARDIMNKFPRPDAAASTEIRAFRETFGTSVLIVSKLWSMLWEEDILPEGGRPKHLLWALHFLKVYPLRDVRPSEHPAAPSTRRPTASGSGRSLTPSRNLSMTW
jgi:hypothetical protein